MSNEVITANGGVTDSFYWAQVCASARQLCYDWLCCYCYHLLLLLSRYCCCYHWLYAATITCCTAAATTRYAAAVTRFAAATTRCAAATTCCAASAVIVFCAPGRIKQHTQCHSPQGYQTVQHPGIRSLSPAAVISAPDSLAVYHACAAAQRSFRNVKLLQLSGTCAAAQHRFLNDGLVLLQLRVWQVQMIPKVVPWETGTEGRRLRVQNLQVSSLPPTNWSLSCVHRR